MANAGAAQAISITRAPYVLNASSSRDPNGDPMTYTWTVDAQPAGASVTLTSANTAMLSFESTVPGDYTFSVTVEDDAGSSSTDNVVVTLIDDAPVANAGPNQTATASPPPAACSLPVAFLPTFHSFIRIRPTLTAHFQLLFGWGRWTSWLTCWSTVGVPGVTRPVIGLLAK